MQKQDGIHETIFGRLILGGAMIISFGLMIGNWLTTQEIRPDYSQVVAYDELNKHQQALMGTFAENRRLKKITLGDNREAFLSESDNRIYAAIPKEWYREDGKMNLTESEQWLLAAMANVELPGGLKFEPPMRAYKYNKFLEKLNIFLLIGVIFGALFARFDLGTKQTSVYRNITVVPIIGIVGVLFYTEFGLAAGAAFIPSALLGYLLLTVITKIRVPALIKFNQDQAANPATKKKPKQKERILSADLPEIAERHQEAIKTASIN